MRRCLLVPRASPRLGGRWELQSSDAIHLLSRASSSRSAFWTLDCISSVHSCRFFSSTLSLYTTLCAKSFSKSLLLLASEARHSAVEVPCLLLLVLEALHFFCACFPTL